MGMMTNKEAIDFLKGLHALAFEQGLASGFGQALDLSIAALSAPKPADRPDGQLDPDMPADQLRLAMGELTPNEVRVARAAIRWANRVQPKPPPIEGLREAVAHIMYSKINIKEALWDDFNKTQDAALAYLELTEG